MKKNPPAAIRLSVNEDVGRALNIAKKLYPTLSDPEILKLGLSKIVRESDATNSLAEEREEIRKAAAYAVGADYLSDPDEDGYTENMGKRVNFK